MNYRLDIGTHSIGWAVLELDEAEPSRPKSLVRVGSRVFPDGRDPQSGESLALNRRERREGEAGKIKQAADRFAKEALTRFHTVGEALYHRLQAGQRTRARQRRQGGVRLLCHPGDDCRRVRRPVGEATDLPSRTTPRSGQG
ncbi:MAG: hypothetical protein KZQ76_06320 [Candidatus Thiodiazotropha sp. (ex Epidulcina cf. delphinae)]|nr:hypothetical protein [Candidatus Thiodiazotropha sp. (ex Epidulcina cf. delphinae)]